MKQAKVKVQAKDHGNGSDSGVGSGNNRDGISILDNLSLNLDINLLRPSEPRPQP